MSGRSQFGSSGRFSGSNAGRFIKNPNPNGASLSNNYAVAAQQLLQSSRIDEIDSMMGFERYTPPQFNNGKFDLAKVNQTPGRVGWLCNMHPTLLSPDTVHGSSQGTEDGGLSMGGIAGVDFYFLDEEGGSFKASITYDPYFFIACTDDSRITEIEDFIKKHLETCVKNVQIIQKEDLSMPNHLLGLQKTLIKLSFLNSNKLFEARKLLRPILLDNANNKTQRSIYHQHSTSISDVKQLIEDIREYDVPYHVRVSIDKDIRVGKWYKVVHGGFIEITERVAFADPVVMAFDIETTKPPLKFPDASIDQVMMISYMIDGEGFLITNREIISEDIHDFEYTPKPEYPGQFTIFNEENELALLQRFYEHIREVRPTVISTFNGDFFDWPFIDARSKILGLDMFDEIGFAPDSEGEYKSPYCSHMDCYRWVKRDSYLPQGSQGLKAVTQVKLGYNPIELDPELMTPYAYEKPQELSEYSVSDAVATYYLYMKYVHPFIFSLCTIIPLNPDEVLRKGTGTLCEMLLMVQAYQNNILLPNKHTDPIERFYDGHLLESETYVGGHVESLEAGVFRSDLKNHFKIDPTVIDELLQELPHAMKFNIETENHCSIDQVTNFEEIKDKITNTLLDFKENTRRHELPLIYHVDVASMYPNIMITNRLQPDSMKTERDCASCDFNRPGKRCDRRLKWSWRGEFFPARMDEYNMIKRALQNEKFPNKNKFSKIPYVTFDKLSYADQVAHIKKRLTEYSKKVYHRTKVTEVVEREAIVCQRENPFYANTVRSFRDRRYEFKGLAKTWKKKLAAIDASEKHERDEAKKMIVLYDSLQLAHKVILNSFYGYVMRKGSRWYSMEMAGITCLTGATIIQMARSVVERVGRPLELDTDGIWCIIPKSFPENFSFELQNGKKIGMSYPCTMLNYKVHQKFTNHQYQELVDPETFKYEIRNDNSIFFEVDGPYKAMVLPTSKEEGKGIKKRYAVFNHDGSLAELKGFELKRRGELQLIKNFQSDIFKVFLEGDTLENCYKSVADVANRWLDVLDTKGAMLEDEDLISLICENRSMSKPLKEYEGQKSTSITTAKRLGEFLGHEIVKDKGLQCKYIISSRPANAPVTERAIPVAIFSTDIQVKRSFLRRWIMDPTLENFDPRAIIDWGYYRERLASVIQKIITIPAALQNVPNPVSRVEHPDWLTKRIAKENDKSKQSSLTKFLAKSDTINKTGQVKDIEDLFNGNNADSSSNLHTVKVSRSTRIKRRREQQAKDEENLLLPKEMPSLEEDYCGWLQYQKIKWRIQVRDRRRREQLFGGSQGVNPSFGLGSMIRKQAESYASSTWEILQYKPSSDLGVLDVFVAINGRVQTLQFVIPKILYLKVQPTSNLMSKTSKYQLERTSAVLPNVPASHSGNNGEVFKITMPEAIFQEQLEDSTGILNHKDVLGIFEASVNITERAILQLGACVTFGSNIMGALGKGLQRGFELKDLSMGDNERYLSRFHVSSCYLLHMKTNIGYEFFVLYKSWSDEINMYILKPSANAQELNLTLVQQVFSELYQQTNGKLNKFSQYVDIKENMTFEAQYFTDLHKVYRQVSTEVGHVKDEKGLQFMLLIHSPYPEHLKKAIKHLNQLPAINMSINEIQLPQLNWQHSVIKKLCHFVFSVGSKIANLVTLSRYSNIPVCNIDLDNVGYIIDILYARKLIHEGHVLWWSQSIPLPDHGGIQKDFDLNTSMLLKDLDFPCINNSDVYHNVVLEVQLRNLTVNTVLGSALINEAEGSDLADIDMADGSGTVSTGGIVQDSFSINALSTLRTMVKEWWDHALQENVTADLLVNSFVNWVQNPDSKLFDGALRYHVHNLAKKALLQMVNEFRNLGSEIIFADRNKLMLKTTKYSPENSYAYGQYMLKAVRANPAFTYVDLSIDRYWDFLMWMDKYNFSGLACTEIEETEKQKLQAYSQWHIKKFLPTIYHAEFDDWIVIVLDSLTKTKEKYLEDNRATQRLTQLLPTKSERREDDDDSPLASFTNLFSKALIKRIQKLYRSQQQFILDPQYASDYEFPILPGSHLNMKNPLLELVKYLCHVMLLSKQTSLEARLVRRELLKVFEVREFDKSAEFQDPSLSLVLYGVHCGFCHSLNDVDICKVDPEIVFNCAKCQKSLGKDLIEEQLIQNLGREIQSYITQDLRCDRCHKIKQDCMSNYCSCSGSWQPTITADSLLARTNMYKQVAAFYDFKNMDEFISTMC